MTYFIYTGVVGLLVLSATMAQAQNVELVRSSLNAGSERLALYSVSEFIKLQPDPQALNLLEQLMTNQSFRLDGRAPDPGLIRTNLGLTPILTYDDNINGGNRNSSFLLGDSLRFTVDPNAVAKEGLVLGAGLSAGLRYGYGRGRYLDARSSVSAVYSPEHDLEKYSTFLEFCSRNQVQGWTFVDGCISTQTLDTDLGYSRENEASLSAVQLFTAGGFDHQVTGTLGRNFTDEFGQTTLGAEITTSLGAPGAISVGFEFGEEVTDRHVLRERFSVSYATRIGDRPVGLSFSATNQRGSAFLGDVREDVTTVFGASTRLTDQISVNARYTHNSSTVDFFEYDSFGVGVNFTGFSF